MKDKATDREILKELALRGKALCDDCKDGECLDCDKAVVAGFANHVIMHIKNEGFFDANDICIFYNIPEDEQRDNNMILTNEQANIVEMLCKDDIIFYRLQNSFQLTETLIRYAEYAHKEMKRLTDELIQVKINKPLSFIEITSKAGDSISTSHQDTEDLEKALYRAAELLYEYTGECPSSFTNTTEDFWEHPEGCENVCNSLDPSIKCWVLYLKDKGVK